MYSYNLERLKNQYHPDCIFNSKLFDLKIAFDENGELAASFICDNQHQGYSDRIHGGVISAIMDSAMTQCLFGHNIVAYTVDLNIRYSRPVLINKVAVLKVKIMEKLNRFLYYLHGAIYQDDKKLITAKAKFWISEDLNQDRCFKQLTL